jgi:hypothetical protein
MKEQLGVERSLDNLHPELEISEDDDGEPEKGEKDKGKDGSKSKDGSATEGKKSESQRKDEGTGKKASDDASERAKVGSWSSAADFDHDEL